MNPKQLFISLLAMGVPLASFAQSPARALDQVEDEETVYLSPFEVSSDRVSGYRAVESAANRVREDLIDTPATINIVTKEFLEDIAATSLIEATQYLSGISYGVLGGLSGIFDRQIIRGFENYESSVDNFALGGIATPLDPSLLEQVEIFKGPNALFAAAEARTGGTTNVVTKSPKFKVAHEIKIEVASKIYGNKGVFDTTGPLPGHLGKYLAYRVVASYQDTNGFVPGKITNEMISPMLTWAVGPKAQLKIKGTFLNGHQYGSIAANENNLFTREDLPHGAVVSLADIRPGYVYGGANGQAPWAERASHVARGLAELTTALGDHLNLRFATMRNYYHFYGENGGMDIERTGGGPWGVFRNPMTGEATPLQRWGLADSSQPWDEINNPYIPIQTFVIDYDSYTTDGVSFGRAQIQHSWLSSMLHQADLAGKWDFGGGVSPFATLRSTAGIAHTANWGHTSLWRRERDHIVGWNRDRTVYIPPTDPPLLGIDLSVPYLPYINNYPRSRTPAVLFFDFKEPRAKVTQFFTRNQLGLFSGRLLLSGGVSHQRRNIPGGVNLISGQAGGGLNESKTSPSYAALYKVTPWASVYASRGQNANAASYSDGTVSHFIWREGKQNEFGIKLEFFNRRLFLTSSYFDLWQTNNVARHPDYWEDPTIPDVLTDIGNKGVEVDVTGQITTNLMVMASYTNMKMRDEVGRERMATPDKMANALVRYSFTRGVVKGLNAFIGVNHVGKHSADELTVHRTELGKVILPSLWLPSRTIFNAGANYNYKSVRFQLNVENLLNKKTLWQPGNRNQLTAFPSTNVRLTTTFKF